MFRDVRADVRGRLAAGLLIVAATARVAASDWPQWRGGTANISTPVISGDQVFVSTGYQTGAALLQLSARPEGVGATEQYFLPHTPATTPMLTLQSPPRMSGQPP
jgi:hypothetical protein